MLIIAFLLATTTLFIQSVLFPHFTLLAYAPWIALIVLSRPRPKSLYLACIAGVVLDLVTDDPIGVHALNYTLIAWFLFRYRRYFNYDQPLHLSLFTLFVSLSSTLLQLFLLFLFDRRVPFAGQWAFGDLLLMPVADALYAFLWFAWPLRLLNQGSVFWRSIKKKLFPTSH